MNTMKRTISLMLVMLVCFGCESTAFAAPVTEATIDQTKTGSMTIYKYDLTNGATRS